MPVPSGWFTDERDRGVMLSIENPLEPSMDVGKNSWAFQKVNKAFGHVHQCLCARIVEVGPASPPSPCV